jgi:threonine aldolase
MATNKDQGMINKVFSSDNTVGAAPAVLQAIMDAGQGMQQPYGNDHHTEQVEQALTDIFECPLTVFLVATGTAANALGLSVLTPPWGAILCHPQSHINIDECGAPEFFTHGAKLVLVDGDHSKMCPTTLAAMATPNKSDPHTVQTSVVSVTQTTETGSIYSLEELSEIGRICQHKGLKFHMDGARFANALVALDCSPAAMTWQAGVDVLSFGTTKNGTLAAEVIVLFDQTLAQEMTWRRKRSGHLLSKMRLVSAQIEAYLKQDLWLDNARHANAMALRLDQGLRAIEGIEIQGDTRSNMFFCKMPSAIIEGLLEQGFYFYSDRWGKNIVRLVTSFATQATDVDHFISAAKALAEAG